MAMDAPFEGAPEDNERIPASPATDAPSTGVPSDEMLVSQANGTTASSSDIPVPQEPQEIGSSKKEDRAPSPHDESQNGPNGDLSSFFKLYTWHPFIQFYCALAEWFDDDPKATPRSSRAKFKKQHPRIFGFSLFLDFAIVLTVVTATFLAVAFIALRTIGVEFQFTPVRIPVPFCNGPS